MTSMSPNGKMHTGPQVAVSRRTRLPERMCVGCRQTRPKGQLMRLVGGMHNQLMVDRQGKLPGRGVYVCPQRSCVELAVKGPRLREALRREVSPGPIDELVGALASALEERLIGSIRMARKAGHAVSGYTQVLRALQHEPVALLLVAQDTAPDRRREYEQRCTSRQIPHRPCLTKARLGELMGRDESSAIGIQDARLSERLIGYLEGMDRLMAR
jgi:predicted RNA-binding protein YlxR (DUF448 family)